MSDARHEIGERGHQCDRCQRIVAKHKMRGSVCDWCADDLTLIDERVAQIVGHETTDEEPLF